MSEWFDYALSDFLLFSPETYWRLFEQMNTAFWPLPIALPGVLAIITLLVMKYPSRVRYIFAAALAACWAIVGHVFLGTYYADINWTIDRVVPFVWVQVALLIVLAPGLRFDRTSRRPWLAHGLLALAFAYPAVGLVAGRPISQAEVVGLAPDPTAMLTIALTALSGSGWRVIVLSVLPIGWLLISAITLLAMDEPTAWMLLLTLLAAGLALLRNPGSQR
ncbi:MAG: DUF6064 family protein [Pseudomonadota bacterium]